MGIDRRGFLASMLALGAAPAIVRAGSLMPVKAMPLNAADAVWTPAGDRVKWWHTNAGVIAVEEGFYRLHAEQDLPYVWGDWQKHDGGLFQPAFVRCRDGSKMIAWAYRPEVQLIG